MRADVRVSRTAGSGRAKWPFSPEAALDGMQMSAGMFMALAMLFTGGAATVQDWQASPSSARAWSMSSLLHPCQASYVDMCRLIH